MAASKKYFELLVPEVCKQQMHHINTMSPFQLASEISKHLQIVLPYLTKK